MTPASPIGEDIKKQSLVSLPYLLAQKNSSLPALRLPPETLEIIFILGARDHYEQTCDAEPTLRLPGWVNVSYVCSRWREVALNCSILWTYHFSVSLHWTEELLARSKQASLKISIRFSWRMLPWLSDLVRKVLIHEERIQELSLYVPDIFLPAGLSLYVPRLEILDIYSTGDIRDLVIKHGGISPLRVLKLTACSLPWHSTFNLSGVTMLFLCRIPPLSQQNVVEFLATLSRMQSLTAIHLEDALMSACDLLFGGAFDISPTISLPSLARLFVVAPLSTVVALLSCTTIPLKTQLKLQIDTEDGSSVDDYARLPLVLARRFNQSEAQSSSGPEIRSLNANIRGCKLLLVASVSGRHDCNLSMLYAEHDHDIPLVIRVGFNKWMTKSEVDRIVSDIRRSIPVIKAHSVT